MHVSLKHARRVVLGVAVGALLLAAAPGSGQADIIQICVSPKGQRVVLPLGGTGGRDRAGWKCWSHRSAGASRRNGSARTGRTDWADRTDRCDRTVGHSRNQRHPVLNARRWRSRAQLRVATPSARPMACPILLAAIARFTTDRATAPTTNSKA